MFDSLEQKKSKSTPVSQVGLTKINTESREAVPSQQDLSQPKLPVAPTESTTVMGQVQNVSNSAMTFCNQVYDKFFSWMEGPAKIASQEVSEMMRPVVEKVASFIHTIDLEKIGRDMTPYVKETLHYIVGASETAQKQVNNYLNELSPPENPNSVVEFLKSAGIAVYNGCATCFNAVGSFIDVVGGSILGEKIYTSVRTSVTNFVFGLYDGVVKFFEAFNERFFTEKQIAANNEAISLITGVALETAIGDAKHALSYLDDIHSAAAHFLGEEKDKSYLSHRILDTKDESDGIKNHQTELARIELMRALHRPVVDVFPQLEDRAEDAKEVLQKAQFAAVSGGRIPVTGPDNELSRIDQMEIFTNGSRLKA